MHDVSRSPHRLDWCCEYCVIHYRWALQPGLRDEPPADSIRRSLSLSLSLSVELTACTRIVRWVSGYRRRSAAHNITQFDLRVTQPTCILPFKSNRERLLYTEQKKLSQKSVGILTSDDRENIDIGDVAVDVVVYVLQTWIVSPCLAVDLARTAAGLFIMLARQSETRCQMNLEILTASIVLNGFWKQFSSAATSVTSALEVF